MYSLSRGALVAVAAVGLAACDSADEFVVPVQVIHAVANAPSVDVSNFNQQLFDDVEFKQGTEFRSVITGQTSLAVDANLPGGTQLTVIGPANVPLVRGNRYSIIATGSVGSVATPIGPVVLENPNTAVTAGNVRVQVVHAAASVGDVDIHVTGPTDPIEPMNALAGGDTGFGTFSERDEIPAADYRIRITAPDGTDPVFDSGTVSLPSGADLVILAMDNTAAGRSDDDFSPVSLLVTDGTSQFEIFDADTPADIRVAHAVSDFNGVDVYVNDPTAAGSATIPGLDFPNVFPAPTDMDSDTFFEVPPSLFPNGTLNVLVTQAGNPGVVGLGPADVPLEQGKQYTIFASNTLAAGIEAYITEDDTRSIATEGRVRIIHLSPAADLVDIYVTEGGTGLAGTPLLLLEDVPFGANTGYLSLADGSYDVTVTVANDDTPAIGPATIPVAAGGVYTAVARDADSTPPVTPGAEALGLILLDDF